MVGKVLKSVWLDFNWGLHARLDFKERLMSCIMAGRGRRGVCDSKEGFDEVNIGYMYTDKTDKIYANSSSSDSYTDGKNTRKISYAKVLSS